MAAVAAWEAGEAAGGVDIEDSLLRGVRCVFKRLLMTVVVILVVLEALVVT